MITKEILDQTDIVAYVDSSGVYRYVSSFWQEKTGVSWTDAVGRRLTDLISGSEAMSAMQTGRKIVGMMYYKLASGKRFSAAVKYRPVRDRQGKICGCMAETVFETPEEAAYFTRELKKHAGKEERLKTDKTAHKTKYTVDDIIGVSSATEKMKEQIYIAAATNATVLIEGETGTGKELVAHAIHDLSGRSSFPFVRVNCSAIPESLMESEFFGYEEGSFTGGVKGGRIGKFEAANHGSLFLDEINAMNITMQPKLLRALQEKEIERIGGTASLPVDDRIIAASNAPLSELVRAGKFRQDLYYRLNIVHIIIPPLRDRIQDIQVLAEFFLKKFNRELNREIEGISEEAAEYLKKRKWPGNIRELQNNIERAMIACSGSRLELQDFTKFGRDKLKLETEGDEVPGTGEAGGWRWSDRSTTEKEMLSDNVPLNQIKDNSEREAILQALEACKGNKTKAAERLRISRTLLYRKMKKYGL